MKIQLRVVRVVTLLLSSLTAAIFVHVYGLLQANWLQHGPKLDLRVLPLPTEFYLRYSGAGYVLPCAAALLLLMKVREGADHPVAFEILLRTVGLVALLWTLGAILAWQLPLYYPVARIE